MGRCVSAREGPSHAVMLAAGLWDRVSRRGIETEICIQGAAPGTAVGMHMGDGRFRLDGGLGWHASVRAGWQQRFLFPSTRSPTHLLPPTRIACSYPNHQLVPKIKAPTFIMHVSAGCEMIAHG